MSYPAQYGFPTHKECTNFRNGICTLSGVAVYPDGLVCPSFTPKSMTETPQAARVYPGAMRSYQPSPPQIEQGFTPYFSPPPPQIGYPPMFYYPQQYPHKPLPYVYVYDPRSPLQLRYGYSYQYGPGYRYPYRPQAYPYEEYPYWQYPPMYAPHIAPMPPFSYPTARVPPMAPSLWSDDEAWYLEHRSALKQQVNVIQEELKRIERRLRELRE